MNQYKSNHEFYQSVFDEVHASDELIMKVQNMTDNKTKKKVYAIRKIFRSTSAVIEKGLVFVTYSNQFRFLAAEDLSYHGHTASRTEYTYLYLSHNFFLQVFFHGDL